MSIPVKRLEHDVATAAPLITVEVFESFLQCETKSKLYFQGVAETDFEFKKWQRRERDCFKEGGLSWLRTMCQEDQFYVGTPSVEALKQKRWRFIAAYVAILAEISAHLDALELTPATPNRTASFYRPLRFVSSEKLTGADRLLLAFDALAISHTTGKTPANGKIIHGSKYRAAVIPLAKLVGKARTIVNKIAAQRAETTPALPILNKHCVGCEFRSHCRQIALQKDDLSLLRTVTTKERKTQNEKGILTVTQPSYAFRPKRSSAHRGLKSLKHEPAVKALAIRKRQIHVVGTPVWNELGHPVYLDVEGVPDRDFYYLIGLRYMSGNSWIYRSFWADDPSVEKIIWVECLDTLALINQPRLIHYGSYEKQFLRRMKARHSDASVNSGLVDHLISSSLNLLSFTYAQIYFPTYSNTLKDVARFLGFEWSERDPSGLRALMWRSEWESFRDSGIKRKLMTYNAEDCAAVQKVADAIARVCDEQQTADAAVHSINVKSLTREYPQRFRPLNFAVPAFEQINAAAYWDYQRNKVYVRSNSRLRRVSQRRQRSGRKPVRINKFIETIDQRPACCSRCGASVIYRNGRFTHTVYDLRFSATGIKRWIVRYLFNRYVCRGCQRGFNALSRQSRCGRNLSAFVVYQVIELRISQHAVARNLENLFGLSVCVDTVNSIKSRSAKGHENTYQAILERLRAGSLIHADETKVVIEGADRYVWVFTNLEEVAFVYGDTREAKIPQEVLRDFRGVLVSDFYAAYDGFDCAHQKCLIHLMRDINEDLRKQPFNEEMKHIAYSFAALLKPIVERVDQFGLKARHLRRHGKSVARFYEALSQRNYQTELATGYRRRFEKYRGRLFTFLGYDGIPWNNNNAEHAIKAFARLRNVIGTNSTAKSMRDYLVLLSVAETCKCKGLNFLSFLRSGAMDINGFDGNL
jgi:predicted RecB family nuclease